MDNLYHIKSKSNTVFYKFCIARVVGPHFLFDAETMLYHPLTTHP